MGSQEHIQAIFVLLEELIEDALELRMELHGRPVILIADRPKDPLSDAELLL